LFLAAIIVAAQEAPRVEQIDYRLPPGEQWDDPLGRRCRQGSGDDVVVCGRRPGGYRVGPSEPWTPPPNLLRSYGVGSGVSITPAISQTYHDSGPFAGMVDRRVTVSVRLPF
jgi:hypothetical protein